MVLSMALRATLRKAEWLVRVLGILYTNFESTKDPAFIIRLLRNQDISRQPKESAAG